MGLPAHLIRDGRVVADRILTTHVGSLPRPDELVSMLYNREEGLAVDDQEFRQAAQQSVAAVVERQRAAGLDIVNDGEQAKTSYVSYVIRRLDGFGGKSSLRMQASDMSDFPDFARRRAQPTRLPPRPACIAPVRWKDSADLETELDDLRLALGASGGIAFLTAASPGIIASFMENQYYSTEEEYLFAIADAMRTEYRAVVEAGFLLQVDCPDLAITGRTELQIAALNRALDGLPPERLRMHLCWGNYEGPHHKDVPLAQILPAVYTARPAMISFEGANPRHAHEWVVFRDLPLPEGKVIMPGLIDTTTNFIEHPELIAQRIERYASVVGRDRVIASTDCGMSTGAGFKNVDPEIAWAKLGALSEGARLASVRF